MKDSSDHSTHNVSIWRRLFVANKWNDIQARSALSNHRVALCPHLLPWSCSLLQSSRLVDVKLTLIVMLMFLRGLNLENLATAQPGVPCVGRRAGSSDLIRCLRVRRLERPEARRGDH